MSVSVELAVEDPSWTTLGDLQSLVERAVAAALAEEGGKVAEAAELSCLFCDDATIRGLNRQWRGLDKPTNVLSFPAAGPGSDHLLGDLALAFDTTAREAAEERKSLADHVAHLVVHGTLHLLGHDHEDRSEAEAMEALEVRALRRLGIADPYSGSVPAEDGGHP